MNGYSNIRRAAGFFALAAAMAASFGGAALAQGYSSWSAHGSLTAKGGTERQIGELDLFVPLLQDNNSMLYLDLRAQSDESDNQEGNAGFGYRWMGRDLILGAYGFYDWRKSDETGNEFTQGMVGFEAMTDGFDLRLNGYLPEDEEQSAPGATTVELVGSTLEMRQGFERGLPGGDGEIGFRLLGSRGGGAELRAFAGGFYFDAPDYRTVAGPRGRIEARLFDLPLLGAGSRFTLGAEVTNDSVRDTQGYAMARLTIPFGGGRRSGYGGLDRRMADYVVRDVDVVTGAAATGTSEPVAYVNTGVTVGDVWLMTGGGALGAATAGVGDLYVLDGTGGAFTTSASFVMAQGQVLLGGESSIDLVGLDTGALATFTAPGARPTINGDVDGSGFVDGLGVVQLATDTMVIGLDIENVSLADLSHAIYGTGFSGAYVTDNGMTSNGMYSFGLLTNGAAGIAITGNNITTSGELGVGIFLFESSNNIVSGNNITTSGASGWGLHVHTGDNNTISNNTISTTAIGGNGLYIYETTNSTVSGNSIATAGVNAMGLWLGNGANNNTISGNSITTAGDYSYGLWSWGSFSNTISSNSIATSGDNADGILLSGSPLNTVSGNTITTDGNFANGLSLEFAWSSTVDGNSITTSGSQAYGINLDYAYSNTIDNNVIVTGQADAPGFYLTNWQTELNTGTGNSYTGPTATCFDDTGAVNTIDLCP